MKQTGLMIVPILVELIFLPILITAGESSQSLVAHSSIEETGEQDDLTAVVTTLPKIYQMHVKSFVKNRYVHTTVVSKVMNLAQKAQEAVFAVVLPDTAFISGFIMEINGKNYTAYVKEKEEAQRVYNKAVARGSAAAHVALSARDSNRFIVSVNIEPETKAAFYLTYEELLKRHNGYYELVINLHPGQPIKDFSAEVIIAESRKITNLKTPPIRSGNEIGNENSELDPKVQWGIINDTSAIVMFNPNLERQMQLAHLLGTKEEEGLAGQFVVQYDVERDPKGGEVLIQDGYFVHFFAPTNLTPIPKHVVFILDTSSSMSGQKIEQLKEAMHKILEELYHNDLFHLVEFNSDIKVWNLDNPDASVWFHEKNEASSFVDTYLPNGYVANADNIKKANDIVSNLMATKSTNIYTALRVGLLLARLSEKQKDGITRQPLIMFLTDGEPTVGVRSTAQIVDDVTNSFNSGSNKSPIFSLSFGDGADKSFLQKLSLRNFGFSKHIYDAADASLQLQNFYKQISSPLLTNVTFKYEPSVTSLTDIQFPVYFSGSEIVVTGWCGTKNYDIRPSPVDAWNGHEYVTFEPVVHHSISSIERLWAYMTIKQLLEKREASSDDKNKEELKKKVLDLALKYSFVTSVSSLVVVKPDNTDAIDTEVAKKRYGDTYLSSYIPDENSPYADIPYGSNAKSFYLRCGSTTVVIIIARIVFHCM